MATWCALCGSEYVDGVVECVDCFVPLVELRPRAVEEVGRADEEQLAYDLDELEPTDRFDIDRRLAERSIERAWDGGSLVVRAADEDVVDEVMDEAAAGGVALDEGDQLTYELTDWSEDQRAQLAEALRLADIGHEWSDEGELIALEADEERVEAILDAIEFPAQLPVDSTDETGDGLAAQDAMSELFVAADRLMHDPNDHEGVLSLVDAARMAEALPLPYGFAEPVRRDLVG
jgi:hypothetical protein